VPAQFILENVFVNVPEQQNELLAAAPDAGQDFNDLLASLDRGECVEEHTINAYINYLRIVRNLRGDDQFSILDTHDWQSLEFNNEASDNLLENCGKDFLKYSLNIYILFLIKNPITKIF
jgi:hypothetical protein